MNVHQHNKHQVLCLKMPLLPQAPDRIEIVKSIQVMLVFTELIHIFAAPFAGEVSGGGG